jgi:hypothetical protein
LDPRFVGSNTAEFNGFSRAIKICSTTSFRGEVKLAISCCKVLHHVKDPYSMKEILVRKIHRHFSPGLFSFVTRCLLVTAGLVDESGLIRIHMVKSN